MANDIIIYPNSASIQFSGSSSSHVSLLVEANGDVGFFSNSGSSFIVSSGFSESLHSFNSIAGFPIFQIFSDYSILAGQYLKYDFLISESKIGIGTTVLNEKLNVAGNISASTITASQLINTSGRVIKLVQSSSTITVGSTEHFILLSNTASTNVNLPTSSLNTNREYWVKNIGSSSVVITPVVGEQIRSASFVSSSYALITGSVCHLICNGVNWELY